MNIVSIQLSQSGENLYLRLASALEDLIRSGKAKEGEGLPPVRKLAGHLNLSNATVIAAYRYLEENGLVYSKRGSGTYVLPQNRAVLEDETGRDALPQYDNLYLPENVINLAGGTPGADMFPVEEFKTAINQVLDTDGGNAFTYQESEGYEGLRNELKTFVAESCAIRNASRDNILITSGAQQAIDLITKVLLRPNDVVLVENPSYLGAGTIFASRGARIIGVPVMRDGINMDVLKYYIKRYRPRLVYTMPAYQTPTGVSMSPDKRESLLALADRYGFYILEEDMISELGYDGRKIPPIKSEDRFDRVVYVKSFSKILMPGLRTGFILAPEKIASDITKAKYITDISTSGLIQRALCVYLKNGGWMQHLNRIAEQFKERMEILHRTLSSWDFPGLAFDKPEGGFGLWLRLPDGVKDYEIYDACLNHGVLIARGSTFYVSPMSDSDRYIRLSYASSGTDELLKGLSVIKSCLGHLILRRAGRDKFIF